MKNDDRFDPGIEMAPLRIMILHWWLLNKRGENCDEIECHIVDYVSEEHWKALMTGSDEERAALETKAMKRAQLRQNEWIEIVKRFKEQEAQDV